VIIAHHEIAAHPSSDDVCELCGKIARTEISDAEGWWCCRECEEERRHWQRCEGCAVLVPITALRHIDGDPAADELCEQCLHEEHEARERADTDGVYVNGTDYER
jgi:hypothetical protein